MTRFLEWLGRTAAYVVHWKKFWKIHQLQIKTEMLKRGDPRGLLGGKVPYAGQWWEITGAERVEQDWDDPHYRYRLKLAKRDADGRVVNVATGIRNTELG